MINVVLHSRAAASTTAEAPVLLDVHHPLINERIRLGAAKPP
jgi:hypothetical protein